MRVVGLPGSLPERSALESDKYQHPVLGSSDHLHHLGASCSCSCWRYKYSHADKLRPSLPLFTPCARPTWESVSRSVFIYLIDMTPLSPGVHPRSVMISPKTYASWTKGLKWQAASGEWRSQPLSIDLYWEIVRTQYPCHVYSFSASCCTVHNAHTIVSTGAPDAYTRGFKRANTIVMRERQMYEEQIQLTQLLYGDLSLPLDRGVRDVALNQTEMYYCAVHGATCCAMHLRVNSAAARRYCISTMCACQSQRARA